MSPISYSGPRRWIAVMLLLAGTLGIAGAAQAGTCPSTARIGDSSATLTQSKATAAEDTEFWDGSISIARGGEVPPAPHDAGAPAAAGTCGGSAFAPIPGTAPAAPQVHSTTEIKPDLDPISGPDPTPHDRPPRQS
jgi:hypothetical protein